MVHISAESQALAERFRAAFEPTRSAEWPVGWRLAQQGGLAVVPLLERACDAENDGTRRLLYLAALIAASGSEREGGFLWERTVRVARQTGRNREEQLLLLLGWALGDVRSDERSPATAFVERSAREPLTPLIQAATGFALGRFPAAETSVPRDWYASKEPAVVAGAWFARPVADRQALVSLLTDGPRLAVRAALLRADPAFAPALVEPLLRHLADADPETSAAAAVFVARSAEPAQWLDALGLGSQPLRPEVLAVLAAEPAMRAELWRRGLLGTPSVLVEREVRARTAVAFGLATDPAALEQSAHEWQDDPVAGALALGLAWRVFRDPAQASEAWLRLVPERPEREWLVLACGGSAKPRPVTFEAVLDRAFLAARDGRLPGDAAADAIEGALWRGGGHPALGRYLAEAALVRDALLSGSRHGSSHRALAHVDPLPRGLSPESPVFEVAYELWRFLMQSTPRPPESRRLR